MFKNWIKIIQIISQYYVQKLDEIINIIYKYYSNKVMKGMLYATNSNRDIFIRNRINIEEELCIEIGET